METEGVLYRYTVHMADDEWSSQENGRIMERLAQAAADKFATKRPLLVTVYEHGGWWLCFLFAYGYTNGLCIGSANDRAEFGPEVKRFREEFENARSQQLGYERRGR